MKWGLPFAIVKPVSIGPICLSEPPKQPIFVRPNATPRFGWLSKNELFEQSCLHKLTFGQRSQNLGRSLNRVNSDHHAPTTEPEAPTTVRSTQLDPRAPMMAPEAPTTAHLPTFGPHTHTAPTTAPFGPGAPMMVPEAVRSPTADPRPPMMAPEAARFSSFGPQGHPTPPSFHWF